MDDRPAVSPRTAALLAALLLCLAAANLWWLANDRHPWWLDEQVHLEKAREVYQALFLGDAPLPARAAAAFRVPPGNPAHPPLLYWSGALLMGVFGYHPDIMTAANTLWFLLLLLGVFALLRTWLPPGEALWGTALAGLTPGVFALSRYFMTDYPAACLVVWGVCALARSECFARTRWVLLFAGVNALALLARTVAPAYYLAPLLWVLAAGGWAALRGTRTGTADTPSENPGAAPPGIARLQPG
ncbi:MAG TPA: glycosyltransferase family 39 protein, partial [Candidatus Hydrogenedentes bacterium]|nr:glycosyltransferase family 39 protein [Candidatus Hydrogenedentota bacterium]